MRAQHLVSVSGGKDSTATYLLAMESGRDFRAVFADTGNEHDAVYEFVSRLHERTGGPKVETVKADFTDRLAKHRAYILAVWPKEGIPDSIVRRAAELHEPTGIPYLDLCILKGRFPSRGAQFCTDELKVEPIVSQVVFPMLRDGPVLQWVGIRAEESAARADQPRYNRHESGSYLWRPIFRWSVEDVWAIHRKHGLARNPLYDMGFDRVGCMPCVNCSKAQVRLTADLFPEHIARIAEWEWIIAQVSKRCGATFFAAGTDPTDTEGDYADINRIVEWSRTGHGGRQFDMFFAAQPGGGCTSDMGVCETISEAA